MKRVFIVLILAALAAGAAFAQRGNTLTLDGTWEDTAGTVYTFSGADGVIAKFGWSAAVWEDAVRKGYIKIGDRRFRNLSKTGDLTWTGQILLPTSNDRNPDVATGTYWGPITLFLSADGRSLSNDGAAWLTRTQPAAAAPVQTAPPVQTPPQVSAASFNGGYWGAVVDSRNALGSLISETSGINFNGRAISGNGVGGNRVSIPAVIQGRAAAVVSSGVTVGSWFYLYSGSTKIGIAVYILSGDYFLLIGAATVSEGLEDITFSGLSTAGMSTTYEGALVK